MALRFLPPKKRRNATEARLRAGAVVLKTASADAKHGAFWTYPDTGKLAAANVCHRLERMGLLESEDGLLPGGGQTYRLKRGAIPPKVRKRWSDPGATTSAPPPKRRRKTPQPEATL